MARSYQHSRVFEEYKQTQEAIKENLTSQQYLQTLDYFLWNALVPIFTECPSLFNNYLVKIAAHHALKASTKFTSDDRQDRHKLPVRMFNMLTAQTPKQALDVAKSMHLNRGLLLGFLAFFLAQVRRYEKLHSPFTDIGQIERLSEIRQIEMSVGLRTDGNLYGVIQQARHWEKKARKWKTMIVEKYTRMALMNAKNTYKEYNFSVPLSDVVQEYLLTVNRAIDRCDSNQGVLTTFIQSWFKSARSEVGKMSKGQNDQSYEALAEQHGDAVSKIIGFVDPNTSGELMDHITAVAKRVDPNGYVRATLGVPEFLTNAEKDMLELFVEDYDDASHATT